MRCVAAVSVGAKACFKKSDDHAVRGFGDEIGQRQGRGVVSGESRNKFLMVFFPRRFGPEGEKQIGETFEVGRTGWADQHFIRLLRPFELAADR
jgi:hypothetical protein